WRADAALQRPVLQERLLQRVQAARGQAFDGDDFPSRGFHRQDQAAVDGPAVQQHAARAAVAVAAAFLGAGQAQLFPQHLQQRLPRLADECFRHPVDGGFHDHLGRHGRLSPPFRGAPGFVKPSQTAAASRIRAASRARRVRTDTRCRLYSALPRTSEMGRAASTASWAACRRCSSVRALPVRYSSAARARTGVGATAPKAIRTFAQVPVLGSRVTAALAPATAMSISLRGVKRRYADTVWGGGTGRRRATSSSPGARHVWPGPVHTDSTGRRRVPPGPAMMASASCTIRGGTPSAEGAALHKLPPRLARFWI